MTFRVLTAELSHETNTFSRRVTDAQSFKDRYFLNGDEAIARPYESLSVYAARVLSISLCE